jgi:hypothetical protein
MRKILICIILVVTLVYCDVSDDRVKIDVYMEAFNQDCQRFLNESYYTALNTPNLTLIADINFYHFGNAKEISQSGTYSYDCENGKYECYGNMYEACMKNLASSNDYLNML